MWKVVVINDTNHGVGGGSQDTDLEVEFCIVGMLMMTDIFLKIRNRLMILLL